MKKKLLVMILGVVLIAAMIGGGTYAYFSSQVTNSANTFTAGTLTAQIDNNGAWGSSASGIWSSPEYWVPGQSVNAKVSLTNTGTIDANHVYFMFGNGTGDLSMMNDILVTGLTERFGSYNEPDEVASLTASIISNGGHLARPDGKLCLADLYNFMPNGYGYYTWNPLGGPTLMAGNHQDYDFIMTLEFDPNTDNPYPGHTWGFDFTSRVDQNSPTAGMFSLHN